MNVAIWDALKGKPFTRAQLLEAVTRISATKVFESVRSDETIARDFLGRTQGKGRLKRDSDD